MKQKKILLYLLLLAILLGLAACSKKTLPSSATSANGPEGFLREYIDEHYTNYTIEVKEIQDISEYFSNPNFDSVTCIAFQHLETGDYVWAAIREIDGEYDLGGVGDLTRPSCDELTKDW